MKKNIAVVLGGYSSEYEISLKSGQFISSIVDKSVFNVFEIIITKEKWFESKTKSLVDLNDFSFRLDDEKIKFDAIVNMIHGEPGENGKLQSYFNLLNIPFVGCDSFVSALTFNKYYCNNFLRNFNLNIAQSFVVRVKENYKNDLDIFLNKVGFPVFVKPSSGGSSFGTHKVKKKSEIDIAIKDAFDESDEVLVEEFIDGRELTCGVVKIEGKITAFTPIEIISKNEFFDYESKYNSDLNQEIIPAPVSEDMLKKIKEKSEFIYEKLNCSGIVRVDYILHEQELFFLELNSIPGMTSESIVPKMIKYDKIDLTDLFTKLINESIL